MAHPARCTGAQIGIGVGGYLDPPKNRASRPASPTSPSDQLQRRHPRVLRHYRPQRQRVLAGKQRHQGGGVDKNNKAGGKGGAKSTTTTTAITRPSQSAFARADFRNPSNLGRLQADLRCRQRRRRNGHGQQPGRAGYDDLHRQRKPDAGYAHAGDAWRREHAGLPGSGHIVFHDFALANYGNSLMGAPIKAEVMTQHATTLSVTTRSLPMVDSWGRLARADGVIALPEKASPRASRRTQRMA